MKTAITQPAILTVSIAALRGLESVYGKKLEPFLTAGHSLGEYTSLVAAGAVSLADGVRLVHLRGTLMQGGCSCGSRRYVCDSRNEHGGSSRIPEEAAQGEVCEAPTSIRRNR